MVASLRQYLDSNGVVLPHDFAAHKINNEHDAFCVFCLEAACTFFLFRYSGGRNTAGAINTKTKCCENCASHVTKMEQEFSGPTVRGGLRETDMDGEEERFSSFVRYSEFDATVGFHYQHAASEMAPYIQHCYFSKRVLDDEPKVIEVPVTRSTFFTGGRILISREYDQKVRATTGKTAEEIAIRKALAQTCFNCSRSYHVTVEENDHREATHNINLYLCPLCAYNQYMQDEPTDLLPERMDYERDYISRCKYCGDSFTLDLMLPFSVLNTRHFSKQGKPMCTHCADSTDGPVAVLDVNDKRLFMYLTKSPNRKIRCVLKTKTHVVEKSYFSKAPNLLDAILEQAVNHTKTPNQLDLFEDG